MRDHLAAVVVALAVSVAAPADAQMEVNPTGIFEGQFGLIPKVDSIADLRLVARYPGKAVHLTDDLRDAVYVWDPDVTQAQYALDPRELNMIAFSAGASGAWVNPTADRSRGLWADSAAPARKLRVTSGLFVGTSAAAYLGATTGNNEFWAHNVSRGRDGVNHPWSWQVNAMNLFERDNGGVNTSIVTRSSISPPGATIGLLTSVVSRSRNVNHKTWAIYGDAIAEKGSAGHVRVGEFNIVNRSGPIANAGGEKPYLAFEPGLRFVLGLAAGGDAMVFGRSFDVDAAIRLNDNGAKFWSGITYKGNALVPDENGEGRAVSMARGHALVWFAPDNGESARIVSTGDVDGAQWRLDFADTAFRLSADGALALETLPVPSAVNHVQVQNAAVGQAPGVHAVGNDPDVDLRLAPAGSGSVIVGGRTGVAADPAAFVATGWLEIKDATGTVRYIPMSDQAW